MTVAFNRRALWFTAAFVLFMALATNGSAVGIAVAVVSAVILDNIGFMRIPAEIRRERSTRR